ncbi:MAG TPA: GNAT family N-acetyltransferase [Urbifossiella sp.]|nr:GNAT family N-acetyltransferase [Urbifossiella sp.]
MFRHRVPTTTIDALTKADVPAATRTLAATFADYPLIRALAPDNPRAAAAAFCGMLVRYTVAVGTAYATADRSAVACWLPPVHESFSPRGLVRGGVIRLVGELGVRGGLLLWRLSRQFDRARRHHVPGPHWYLVMLGVAPAARRRGLARAVLQPGLAAADRDGLPCYLETQDEATGPFYARLGFRVAGRNRMAGGLWNWELVREPGAQGIGEAHPPWRVGFQPSSATR